MPHNFRSEFLTLFSTFRFTLVMYDALIPWDEGLVRLSSMKSQQLALVNYG
jgi:hypothetical protein